MAITLVAATGTNAVGTTSCTPAYPAGIVAYDALWLGVGACHSTVVTMPAITGWTLIYDLELGGGAIAAGTGPRRCGLYRKDVVDGTETGTITVTPVGGSDVVVACIIGARATSKLFEVTYSQGQDTSAGAATAIDGDSVLGESINDKMFSWGVVPANTNISGQALTATGATIAAVTEFSDAGSANGDDARCSWIEASVTAGKATAATHYAASSTHSQGQFFIRIKEATGTGAKFGSIVHPGRKPAGGRFMFAPEWRSTVLPTSALQHTVDQTDSVGLSDSVAQQIEMVRTDQVGLTDAIEQTVSNVYTDQVGLTDAHTEEVVKSVEVTDNTGLTDSFVQTQQYVYEDQVGLTDSSIVEGPEVQGEPVGMPRGLMVPGRHPKRGRFKPPNLSAEIPNTVAVGTIINSAVTSWVTDIPQPARIGDTLVAFFAVAETPARTLTPPVGWVPLKQSLFNEGAANLQGFWHYKTLKAGDVELTALTVTWTFSVTSQGVAGIIKYSGTYVHPIFPIHSMRFAGTPSASTHPLPPLNTSIDGCIILAGAAVDTVATAPGGYFTPPAGGWTERLDREQPAAFVDLTFADRGLSNPGTIGGTFTGAATDVGVVFIMALNPAGAIIGDRPSQPGTIVHPGRKPSRQFRFPPDWRSTDLPAVAGDQTVTQTDSVGLTDGVEFTQELVREDQVGLSDSVAKMQALEQTDQIGLSDSHTEEITKTVTQTDSVGLSDGVEKTVALVREDQVGLSDAVSKSIELERSDQVGLTDSMTQQVIKDVTTTDSVGLTDAVLQTQSLTREDQVGLSDQALKSVELTRTDQTGLTDSQVIESGKVVQQTDSVGLTDSVVERIEMVHSDNVGLTDAAEKTVALVRTDQTGLTDAATQQKIRDLTQTDSVGLTDSITSVASYSRTITDDIGLSDTQLIEGVSPAVPPETLESEGRSATAVESQGTATGIDGHGEGTTIEGRGGSSTLDGGGRSTGSGGIDG